MKKLAAAPCAASTPGRAATTAGSEARMQRTTDWDVTLAAAFRATGRPRWPAAKDTDVPLVTRTNATSAAASTADSRSRRLRDLARAAATLRCAPEPPVPPPARTG